jgi:hypothetical protein
VAAAYGYIEGCNMKNNLEKRLQSLEETGRPWVISTLADLEIYAASDSDEEVELRPQLQELFELLLVFPDHLH